KGSPSWSTRAKSGTTVCTAFLPISPFLGGIGKWASAGAAQRPRKTGKQASVRLTLHLEFIGDVQLLGIVGKLPLQQIGAGILLLLSRQHSYRQKERAFH